jgi:hypothetical protein
MFTPPNLKVLRVNVREASGPITDQAAGKLSMPTSGYATDTVIQLIDTQVAVIYPMTRYGVNRFSDFLV